MAIPLFCFSCLELRVPLRLRSVLYLPPNLSPTHRSLTSMCIITVLLNEWPVELRREKDKGTGEGRDRERRGVLLRGRVPVYHFRKTPKGFSKSLHHFTFCSCVLGERPSPMGLWHPCVLCWVCQGCKALTAFTQAITQDCTCSEQSFSFFFF